MNRLIAAIQFLTLLPLGRSVIYDPKGMVPFFPMVGLIIGAFVSMFDHAALFFWPKPVVAVLDVVFLVVITAALHLDGLGDTADGLMGHRSRDKALAIMKDSRIGVMGLVAIVCGLAVKWAGIMHLDSHRTLLLILIPAYARSGMLFGIRFLPYGRPGGGTGRDLFGEQLQVSAFWGLLIPLLLSYFIGWRGLWLRLLFVMSTAVIIMYFKKRMGCITGDILGAMAEWTESRLFLLV